MSTGAISPLASGGGRTLEREASSVAKTLRSVEGRRRQIRALGLGGWRSPRDKYSVGSFHGKLRLRGLVLQKGNAAATVLARMRADTRGSRRGRTGEWSIVDATFCLDGPPLVISNSW